MKDAFAHEKELIISECGRKINTEIISCDDSKTIKLGDDLVKLKTDPPSGKKS